MEEELKMFDYDEGMCPLLHLPCPQGKGSALQCQLRCQSGFDPVASFSDLCMLECARERAAKMRGATIKFLY